MLLRCLDLRPAHRRMRHHGPEAGAVAVVRLAVVDEIAVQAIFAHHLFIERRSRRRTVDEELREIRMQIEQSGQLFLDDRRRLIRESDDHRGQHADAVRAQLAEQLRHRAALLLGVSGARPFVADPESVDPHLQDLRDRVLADGLDAGEGEDRERAAAGDDAVAQLEGSLPVEEEVLVQDDRRHPRLDLLIALDHAVDVVPAVEQADVFSLEEVRRAAEIAAVGTAEAPEDHAGAGDLAAEQPQPADDDGMPPRCGALAEELLHEDRALLAADEIRPRRQLLVGQHRAVPAEDDPRLRRVPAHQRRRLLHPVKRRQYERDPDVFGMFPQLANQLAPAGVMEDGDRRLQILGDVLEGKLHMVRAGTEESLLARDLPEEQLVTDARRIAVALPEGPAHTGEKYVTQ